MPFFDSRSAARLGATTPYRVRHDRVDEGGSISLRVNGRLHHIGIGRTHTGTRVILLINDLDSRIIQPATWRNPLQPHPRPRPVATKAQAHPTAEDDQKPNGPSPVEGSIRFRSLERSHGGGGSVVFQDIPDRCLKT